MNIITLTGRIFGEITTKEFDTGSVVTRFKLSVSTGKDKNGEYKPSLVFECNAWGKLGTEVIAKYAKEKDFVALSGEITAMTPWSSGEKSGVNCNVDVRTFELGGKQNNETNNGAEPGEKVAVGKQSSKTEDVPF